MFFFRFGVYLCLFVSFTGTVFSQAVSAQLKAERGIMKQVDGVLFRQATLNARGKKVESDILRKVFLLLDTQPFSNETLQARALVGKIHAWCLLKRFSDANLLIDNKLAWLSKVKTFSTLAGAFYFRAVCQIGLARKAVAKRQFAKAAELVRGAFDALKTVKVDYMRTAYSVAANDLLAALKNGFVSNRKFSEKDRTQFATCLADPAYRFSDTVTEAEAFFQQKRYLKAKAKFQAALAYKIKSRENALILSHLVISMVHNGMVKFDKLGRYRALDNVLGFLLKAHRDRLETAQCCLMAGDLYYLYAMKVEPARRFDACAAAFNWYEIFFGLVPTDERIPEISYKMAETRSKLLEGLKVIRSQTSNVDDIKELDKSIKIQLENNRRDYQRCADDSKNPVHKKQAAYRLAETFTELGGEGYVTAAVYYHYYAQLETDPAKLEFCLMAELKAAEGLLKGRVFTHAVSTLETVLRLVKEKGGKRADLTPIREKALWMLVLAADQSGEYFAGKVATTKVAGKLQDNVDFKRYVNYKATALGALDKFLLSCKDSLLGEEALKKRAALVKELDRLGYRVK